jgi:Protein of unknown function (DUF1573)
MFTHNELKRSLIGLPSVCLTAFGLSFVCLTTLHLATSHRRAASNRSDLSAFPPRATLLPLVAEPDTVDLGRLAPGQNSSRGILLVNRASAPVTVDRIETSCPCISAKSNSPLVQVGQSALLTVNYDGAEDPQFRGTLAVECTGLSSGGDPLFRIRVDLSVVSSPIVTDAASLTNPRDHLRRVRDDHEK